MANLLFAGAPSYIRKSDRYKFSTTKIHLHNFFVPILYHGTSIFGTPSYMHNYPHFVNFQILFKITQILFNYSTLLTSLSNFMQENFRFWLFLTKL